MTCISGEQRLSGGGRALGENEVKASVWPCSWRVGAEPFLLVLARSPGPQRREPLPLTMKEQMQVDGTPSRKQIPKAWVLLETSLEDLQGESKQQRKSSLEAPRSH